MSILNIPASSANGVGNTGISDKKFDLGRITSLLLVPVGFEFSAAECLNATSFKTALQSWSTKDDRNVRIYPIHGITGIEISDTEATKYTSGYGEMRTLSDGKYGMTFTFLDDLKRHANLRQFNNEDYAIILVDENGKFLGTKGATGLLTGATGIIHTEQFKMPTASEPSLYKTTVTLSNPSEVNELDKLAFMDCDNSFNFAADVPGVVSIYMTALALATTKITVQIFTTDGGVNMYDAYDTEFAAATTAWNVTKQSDDSAITVTSVTAVPATKSWEVAFTNPGATSLPVNIFLDGPATLDTAGIGGTPGICYEQVYKLKCTMPV